MQESKNSRRGFLKKGTWLGAGTLFGTSVASRLQAAIKKSEQKSTFNLAKHSLLEKERRMPQWPRWPQWIPETDEQQVLEVLRSGVWSRAAKVNEFETRFAEVMGSKRCLTTVNGTNALICALTNLGVGDGDEVIVTPYTFIATIQAILQVGAMPVFVDIDPWTFQINPDKIEAKISSRTKAILPVHIAGLPSDMKKIMAIAKKHDLIVIEDACQAHLAEIDHKKVGTFGHAGCFSFQNSKNLPIGEGGAILSDDEKFMDKCYSYHNYGIAYGSVKDSLGSGIVMFGTKLRITEYQAAIGLAQLNRLDSQTTRRNENAKYLTSQIDLIAGVIPPRLIPGVTRGAWHLYPFRYQKQYFNGMERDQFIKALKAEGVPCSGGYDTINDKPYLKDAFQSERFKKSFSENQLHWESFLERNKCPENESLCKNEAVWFNQNLLLGTKEDMSYIALAIQKIYKNSKKG